MKAARVPILVVVAVVAAGGFLLALHQKMTKLNDRIGVVSTSVAKTQQSGQPPAADVEKRLKAAEDALRSFEPLKKIASDEAVSKLVRAPSPAGKGPPAGTAKGPSSAEVAAIVDRKIDEKLQGLSPEKPPSSAEMARLSSQIKRISDDIKAISTAVSSAAKASTENSALLSKLRDTVDGRAEEISKLAEKVAAMEKGVNGCSSDIATLKENARAVESKVVQDVKAVEAELNKALEMVQTSSQKDIVITGTLNLEAEGNDIKLKLATVRQYRKDFERVFEKDPKTGRIQPKTEFKVLYFVSPLSVSVPRRKWLDAAVGRRITCSVDSQGIVSCGGGYEEKAVEGIVNFLVIARYVGKSK